MLNRFYDFLFPKHNTTQALKTSLKNLHIDNLSYEHWIEHLICPITLELMTDPVIVVNSVELEKYTINPEDAASEYNFALNEYICTVVKDDVREDEEKRKEFNNNDRIRLHVADRSSIESAWQTANGVNPFNRDQDCHMISYTSLQQEISVVLTMLEYIKKESNGEPVDNNQFITIETSIPERFKCPFTKKMLTYPVKLDGEKTADLLELMQWWAELPINRSINPFTLKPIKQIEFQHELYHELKQFVIAFDVTNKRPALTTTLANVQNAANSYPSNKVVAAHLDQDKNFQCLLSSQTMVHPVIIDKTYTVDLAALKSWWLQNPKYDLRNPITGEAITTIEYDHDLKQRIDHNAYSAVSVEPSNSVSAANSGYFSAAHQRLSTPIELADTLVNRKSLSLRKPSGK